MLAHEMGNSEVRQWEKHVKEETLLLGRMIIVGEDSMELVEDGKVLTEGLWHPGTRLADLPTAGALCSGAVV